MGCNARKSNNKQCLTVCNLSIKLYRIYVCYTNITLYHAIYSVWYYPQFHVTMVGLGTYYLWIWGSACVCVCMCIYTGCNRRNGPNFRRVFLMLNYTEKTQNTYIQSWTVWEIMTIENCGLPSGPRAIALSWDSYLLVSLLAELCADARVKCISFKVSSTRCGFLVTAW
jgi:hypothetical protein